MIEYKIWDELNPAEKVERWSHAVDVIAGLSEHERTYHFNMAVWGDITDCGTIGCAAGFCGMDPEFKEQGLEMEIISYHCDKKHHEVIWPKIRPFEFFGSYAYDRIFVNPEFTDPDHHENRQFGTSGRATHARVLKEMQEYLEELKLVYKG